MKSRIPLLLMEQMVMLLVFAFSAALCLQAFVLSDRISERSDNRDRAVTLVQEAAETVRHYGSVETAAELLDADYADGNLHLYYGEDWEHGGTDYVLRAEEIPSGTPGLGMARVALEPCAAPADPLFEVTVTWQEALMDTGEVDSNGA